MTRPSSRLQPPLRSVRIAPRRARRLPDRPMPRQNALSRRSPAPATLPPPVCSHPRNPREARAAERGLRALARRRGHPVGYVDRRRQAPDASGPDALLVPNPSRLPKNGKPVSSRFPAGFQPGKIQPFQSLTASRPGPWLSRPFAPIRGPWVGYEVRWYSPFALAPAPDPQSGERGEGMAEVAHFAPAPAPDPQSALTRAGSRLRSSRRTSGLPHNSPRRRHRNIWRADPGPRTTP